MRLLRTDARVSSLSAKHPKAEGFEMRPDGARASCVYTSDHARVAVVLNEQGCEVRDEDMDLARGPVLRARGHA